MNLQPVFIVQDKKQKESLVLINEKAALLLRCFRLRPVNASPAEEESQMKVRFRLL